MPAIHPLALVHASAEIGPGVSIGPYTTIEAGVQIGPGCQIGAYVTLGEGLRLGREVQVFNYACLGTASQDKKHKGEPSRAEIGDRAVIREFVTVNRATREGGLTRVGPGALLMAYVHVAHESDIGEGAILVNAVTVGGEVVIEPFANLGGHACIHQFCRIGRHSMIGANSKVTQDIPPFLIADGHPARPYGPNVIGLRRSGFSDEQMLTIRRIYRELFVQGDALTPSLERIEARFGSGPLVRYVVDFCRASRRGIARPRALARVHAPGQTQVDQIETVGFDL